MLKPRTTLASLITFFLLFSASLAPNQAFTYYPNMPASIVIGQPDFSSNAANQGNANPLANTLNGVSQVFSINGKLFVFDGSNNRALIYNHIPTTNNAAADVVIGQPDFTSSTGNNGGRSAKTLNTNTLPNLIASDGTKVVVSDVNNSRVLIWNQIPTSNFAPADVVLGQPDFTSGTINNGGISAHSLYQPQGISIDPKGRLIVSDFENDRVLVWNSIPTTNNQDADLVIGQPDFTTVTNNGTPTDRTFRYNRTAFSDGENLFVSDQPPNCRVLIWRGFPTQNYEAADVVLGANDFTTSACSNPISASGPFNNANAIYSDGNRLAIAIDGSNRVLVWNSIPDTNNQPADIVIGQPDFTSGTANQGGSTAANTLSAPRGVWFDDNRLIVGDLSNRRVLIFDNVLSTPELSLNTPLESIAGGKLKASGNIRLGERGKYSLQTLKVSVNAQGFSDVTHRDGGRDDGPGQTLYEFYHEFEPWAGISNRETYNPGSGYTVKLRASSYNADMNTSFY